MNRRVLSSAARLAPSKPRIPTLPGRRLQSTTSAPTPTPTPSALHSDASTPPLNWAQYLSIRKGKRRWETATTIPLAVLGFAGGIMYFGSQEIDPTKMIFGVDPMLFYGFATVGCAGAGALIGPSVGAAGWRFTHRKTLALIDAREREFHKRIVRNRVDPSRQSATNPVPDFYGEKIGSIPDYRQWLRDQNKFRRKARWLADEEI